MVTSVVLGGVAQVAGDAEGPALAVVLPGGKLGDAVEPLIVEAHERVIQVGVL